MFIRIKRCGIAALVIAAAAAPAAQAAGPWNMPTNLRQCLGFGVGPGYHAPMILSNPLRSTTAAKGVVYVRHPPSAAHCANGFCGSMSSLGGCTEGYTEHVYASPAAAMSQPMTYEHAYPAMQPTLAPTRVPGTPVAPSTPVAPAEPASPSDRAQPEQIPLPRA